MEEEEGFSLAFFYDEAVNEMDAGITGARRHLDPVNALWTVRGINLDG